MPTLTTKTSKIFLSLGATILAVSVARAGDYRDTISLFKHAGESNTFFTHSYAYAVFPTIGEGGLIVGGAHGRGRVYVHGRYAGAITMSQVSVGLQAGGKAFSQIIFFVDRRALKEFESGSFQFAADASVIAVTASARADAGTTGTAAEASGGPKDAVTAGEYQKGMVVFTIAKGGAMFDVSVAGQKFAYKPRDNAAT